MWKVLLVIASVVLGGAIYLSYENMSSIKQVIVSVEEQEANKEQRTVELAKAAEEVGVFEKSIQLLQTETGTLQTSKIDLDAKIAEGEANQKALEAKLVAAKAELETANKTMGDVVLIEGIQKEMLQIRTQIEESEIELTGLEGAVAAAQVDRDRFEKVAAELAALRTDQEAGVIRGEFQSQIKKAYNQWGFVVVAGGNDQGVVDRAQLDVYRRGQPICRLLVTSVEPTETVADIIAGSLAPGQTVQVGDTVVKTVRAETPAVVPATEPAAGLTPATLDPAPAPAGGEAPGMAPAAAPDPFGNTPAAPTQAPPTAPNPFGAAPATTPAGATPAPAAPDPFGAAPTTPPAGTTPAPAAPGAVPDPFGAAPAPGGTPPPAPAPSGTPAPGQ